MRFFMRRGLLVLACLCGVATQVRAQGPACGLLDDSAARLATLARGWRENWPLERLQTLWGRQPDRLDRDSTGAVDRAAWSEGSFESVGCSVSVNLGDAESGRGIYVTV